MCAAGRRVHRRRGDRSPKLLGTPASRERYVRAPYTDHGRGHAGPAERVHARRRGRRWRTCSRPAGARCASRRRRGGRLWSTPHRCSRPQARDDIGRAVAGRSRPPTAAGLSAMLGAALPLGRHRAGRRHRGRRRGRPAGCCTGQRQRPRHPGLHHQGGDGGGGARGARALMHGSLLRSGSRSGTIVLVGGGDPTLAENRIPLLRLPAASHPRSARGERRTRAEGTGAPIPCGWTMTPHFTAGRTWHPAGPTATSVREMSHRSSRSRPTRAG